MRPRRWTAIAGIGAAIVAVCWLFALPAWSAEKPPAATKGAAQQGPAEPTAFGVTEVIPRSERALSRLRQIREKLDADNSVGIVEAGLPGFERQLKDWWTAENQAMQKGGSVQRATDLLWEWGLREAQLNAWRTLLADSSREWVAEEQTLDRLSANWQATAASLNAATPPAVREKITEVLRESEETRRLFRSKIARLVAVQSSLAARHAQLVEIRAQIDGIQKSYGLGLMSVDSPPIWAVTAGAHAGRELVTQARDAALMLADDANRFLDQARAHAAAHLILLAALAGHFLLLRRASRKGGAVQPTAAEQRVMDRSFSSAILVALCLTPLIYVDTGPKLLRLAILPALVPLVILAPAVVSVRYRPGFHIFLVVYLIDFLRNYLPPQSLLARLLLLSVAVLGSLAVALLLRNMHRAAKGTDASGGLLGPLLLVGLACFVGSGIANLAGNLSVAEYLVSPLLRAVFLGISFRLGAIVVGTFTVMSLRTKVAHLSYIIRQRGDAAAHQLRRIINLGAVLLWIYSTLFNFGLLGGLQNALEQFMKLEWQVGAAVISVRDIVTFFLVLVGAYVISRVLRIILSEEVFPRIQMPRGVPDALELLTRYGILLFGFLLALTSAGVNLSQVTLALSALGVGIGFGLQHLVNNFVSGLILVFEHPIQVGDYVEVGPHYGRVHRIGFRASMVLTRDGAEVIIPNGELIGSKVINWSLSHETRRLNIPVPVPPGVDVAATIELLERAASACPQVLADPPPHTTLEPVVDGYLKLILHCWARVEDYHTACDQVTRKANEALRTAGIAPPVPQADVHLHFPDKRPLSIQPVDAPR